MLYDSDEVCRQLRNPLEISSGRVYAKIVAENSWVSSDEKKVITEIRTMNFYNSLICSTKQLSLLTIGSGSGKCNFILFAGLFEMGVDKLTSIV